MRHAKNSSCDCSRRSFLQGAGLTLAGFGITSLFPGAWIRYAMGTPEGSSSKRLLFIFLRGGNDGINAVLPIGDSAYSTTNRPTLYISPSTPAPNTPISLGNSFAYLHPRLGDMMPVFNSGDLAVVHRVGFPNNSRSHFDDQRTWENGNPANTKLYEGWLYRYIQENAVTQGVNLPALSIQNTQPVILRGQERFVNIADPNTFDYINPPPKRTKYQTAWLNEYSTLGGLEPYRPILSDAGVKLIDTLDEYRSWDQLNWKPTDPSRIDFNGAPYNLFPVDDATNPATSATTRLFSQQSYPFFKDLKVCALSLLESDPVNMNGTRIAGTELGSFDTHTGQGQVTGTQAELLSWLAYGFRSLQLVLSGAASNNRSYPNIWDDTVVVTLSEFGRTSKENGSAGTDHAAASCLFAAGGRVHGGVYNCDPSTWPTGPGGAMFGDSGRYLSMRTDYRAIFWEILRDHMGAGVATVDTIFPGYSGLGLQELNLI